MIDSKAHRSRFSSLFVVVLLVAASCNGSDGASTTTVPPPSAGPSATVVTTPPSTTTSTTTTTVAPTTTTTTTLPPAALPTFEDDGDLLPVDPDVLIGTLSSGLTYYIRQNTRPGRSAQLRLVVKAGSVQESDAQRGAAHYLEHMMFNGTERFPGNELVRVLQRFGAEFGADINAYTSYEETVYQLELSTDDVAILESGLDVLLEWATAVTLDPVEVDLERGVLLEEWRLRDQGFWGRYFAGVTERLLEGSAYADRRPLADPDQIETTTPEGLRAFYEAWYRPDTMAIVAVGDFDVGEVEAMIRERFSAFSGPADPQPVPRPSVAPTKEAFYFVIADPEFPEAWSELNYPLPSIANPATVGALRQGLAIELAFEILATRIDEDTLRGSTPFFDSGRAGNDLVRAHRTPGILAWADPDKLGAATESLLTEIGRARVYGFTQEELNRAVEQVRSAVQQQFDGRATTQDREYAAAYVEHFLGSGPIPAHRDEYDLYQRLLDEMTVEQVGDTFAVAIDSTAPFVIIVGPQSSSDDMPDEAELAEIVAKVNGAAVEPRADGVVAVEALMERPAPSRVADRVAFSGTTVNEIILENGARIVMWPTAISDDFVVLRASSPGGWAQLPAEDVAEARLVVHIVELSGVGEIDQVSLNRALSDEFVSLSPFISEVTEGFSGGAATNDLETLFQLVNLYMTRPRFGEIARDLVISEARPNAAHARLSPDLAVPIAIAEARFSGDARFDVILSLEDLDTFDLVRAEEVYRDRFGNPGDFVFVFTGDFELDELEDLARRYLGTIPGSGGREDFVDIRPDPPEGIVEVVVEAGTGELGGVTFLFSTLLPLDPETRIEIAILEQVLRQRLVERIREELSSSYSPSAVARIVEEPEDSVELTIDISADPAGLAAVVEATLTDLADLRANGPTADEMGIAQEQLAREYLFSSNQSIAADFIFYAEHPNENLLDTNSRVDRVLDATRRDIRNIARILLPADRYIEVRLVPIGFEG